MRCRNAESKSSSLKNYIRYRFKIYSVRYKLIKLQNTGPLIDISLNYSRFPSLQSMAELDKILRLQSHFAISTMSTWTKDLCVHLPYSADWVIARSSKCSNNPKKVDLSGPVLPVPKFKKGLGTNVHIVKITSYQKNNPTTRNIS